MLQMLLKLPAFVFVVWCMFWSLPLSNVFGFMQAWRFWGGRNDMYEWCHFLTWLLRLKVRKYGSTDLYRQGPCMFLSNHRSWADFFIDAYLTEGRGQLMSRLAVLYVFPMFMIPVILVRGCICFKRGSIADKQAFNAWIAQCVADSPVPGICLFPEGHRSLLPTSLPLKRGMLHYAFSRQMPVQVVMSAHKENVLDEKRRHVRFGATCVTGYSSVLQPASYASFDDFFADVQATWADMWTKVFSAEPADLPLLRPQVPGWRYPLVLQLSQLFWAVFEAVLAGWLVLQGWRLWAAAVGALASGPAQLVVLWAPVAWLLVSVVSCWDTSLPTPMLRADGSVCALANGSSSSSSGSSGGTAKKAA